MPIPAFFDLTGRHALVTGASRGIGYAIAEGLAACGAHVIITGRKPDSLQSAARSLREKSADVTPIVAHQGDPSDVANLFTELDRVGSPDIVVVNAATNPVFGPLLDVELAAWQKIVEVNVTGALLTAQHACRRMLPRRKG